MLNRKQIQEVYAVLEWHWHIGGILWERPSNERRFMSTGFQLNRMRFVPRKNLEYRTLNREQKSLYKSLLRKWGLVVD